MRNKVIGIIGGEGKMGTLFRGVFEKHFQEVLISSTSFTNLDLVKAADIIVFSVPIEDTTAVIESLLPEIREDQLLLDFTSLKEAPCRAMLRSKAAVIGLHPMFGPSVRDLRQQTIVLCPMRPKTWLQPLKAVLGEEGAILLETEPKRHDEMMAIVQCLVHFTSMVFSHTMKEKGIDPQELFHYASPVYRMQLYIAGRIARQSPELYRSIQFENPGFPEILKLFESSFKSLKSAIKEKDNQAFESYFNGLKDYLGSDVLETGQDITNQFTALMAEKGE